jgi:hypothetical protein
MANTQIRKYANTQIRKYANTQIRKYANTQIRKYANTQIRNSGLKGRLKNKPAFKAASLSDGLFASLV